MASSSAATRDGIWHRVDGRGDLVQLPDIVVFRWEAPLFFANAGIFRQQLRSLVRRRQPRWIVLQCEAVTDVDVTAAERLEQLDIQLNEQGVHLAFVELRDRLAGLLLRYGLYETLDRDHFYDSMDEALEAIATLDAARGVGPEGDTTTVEEAEDDNG